MLYKMQYRVCFEKINYISRYYTLQYRNNRLSSLVQFQPAIQFESFERHAGRHHISPFHDPRQNLARKAIQRRHRVAYTKTRKGRQENALKRLVYCSTSYTPFHFRQSMDSKRWVKAIFHRSRRGLSIPKNWCAQRPHGNKKTPVQCLSVWASSPPP